MVKQTVLHTHSGILCRNKKELIIDTHNNLEKSPGNYTEWMKLIAKVHIVYDFIYKMFYNNTIVDMENKLVELGVDRER